MFRRRRHPEPTTDGTAKDSQGDAGGADRGPSPVIGIDDRNFFEQTAGRYTIVDLWAPWCGPCRSFAPVFETAARRHGGSVAFGACNVDASPVTASLLQVQSIPTLVVFGPDGSEVGRVAGPLSGSQLEQLVGKVTALAARARAPR